MTTLEAPATNGRTATHIAAVPLPDAVLDRLGALGDVESGASFAVGDIAIELIDELGQQYAKAEIRAAMATALKGIGPSGIRAREATARYWPPEAREEFDGLTYSHFRLAMRQPEPEDDLRWCLESADEFGGQPAPFAVYAAMVAERKQPPAVDPYALITKCLAQLETALDCPNVPQASRDRWMMALNCLMGD